MTYEKFVENDNSFKIDIYYENGDAHIHFWNPGKESVKELPEEEYFKTIKDKIQEIEYDSKLFSAKENWMGYYKRFYFSEYESMTKQDEALYIFVSDFMKALNAKLEK
ncbi:hypothetical protein NBRC110019_03740 [Neptunitalea chrysea]|uniref:Uncharacterized protein n=1 Tax=Neptunitalea chrysea TaxID=1647581 RepID=A0A9W6ET86_9FLAO|nr:hypothetical protein [Neptunitalea chrysea]GLB51335.1 hypothetical protein NBRC110019_03740 [Neptunitalea chrysea]